MISLPTRPSIIWCAGLATALGLLLSPLNAGASPASWEVALERQADRDEVLRRLPPEARVQFEGRPGRVRLVGPLGWTLPDRPVGDVFAAFLARFGSVLTAGPVDRLELRPGRVVRDAHGQVHLRSQQWLQGVAVLGGALVLHFDARDGALIGVEADLLDPAATRRDSIPGLAAGDAVAAALAGRGDWAVVGTPQLLHTNLEAVRGALVWEVRIASPAGAEPQRVAVLVDARTGALHTELPLILHARERRIWDANFTTDVDDEFLAGESYPCNQGVPCDADGLELHRRLATVYDYFLTHWGRDSLDDAGMAINGTVKYGIGYNNAFYMLDQDWLVFGNGGGGQFNPLARSLDIVTHEYVHGISKYAAGLVYNGQTAAIGESLSDVIASRLDYEVHGSLRAQAFHLADDVYTPDTPGDALRYLDDPARSGSGLDHYADLLANPQVAAHRAAGIGNLAFKLSVTGGTHPRGRTSVSVPALGMPMAAAIWSAALDSDVLPTETYTDLRQHTAAAAARLYGAPTADAVHWAWDAVGVPGSPHVPPSLPASLGALSESCYGFYTANWSAGPGPGQAATYDLQYAATSDFAMPAPLYSGPETSRQVSLPAGGYLRVRACNAYGCSAWRSSSWLKYYAVCL